MATDTIIVTGQRVQSDENTVQRLGVDGLVSPDDYYLEKVELITLNQTINLKGVMSEISYYEDIFRGTITGHVLINDSISLIDRLALCGMEYINLVYRKSSQASFTFDRKFRVYRVGERVMKNNDSEIYTLHFCSDALFLSEQIKVSKSYEGKISSMVTDILTNQMKLQATNNFSLEIGNTKGVYNFIIPYKKPFEAINWLANYALPEKNTGADFVFFENVDGINFLSLQTLYNSNIDRTFIYQTRTTGSRGLAGELGTALTGIKSYNFLDTFDTLYGTTMGAFANRLISVDPLLRKNYNTEFNYSDYFKNSKSLNSVPIISDLRNALGKTAYENYDSVLKVLTSNQNQEKAQYIKDKVGSTSKDIFVEKWVPNRTAQLALSHYSRIKMAVSGDPLLAVGRKISVVLPSMRSPDGTGNNVGERDSYHSGNYLITSVRHIIDVNMKYETVLEVTKESLNSALPLWKKQ